MISKFTEVNDKTLLSKYIMGDDDPLSMAIYVHVDQDCKSINLYILYMQAWDGYIG